MPLTSKETKKVFYPAVFHEEDNKFWVEFPNLKGCLTEGGSFDEALSMAEDALGEWLNSKEFLEIDKFEQPSDILEVMSDYPNERVSMIEYDDIEWKRTHSNKSIKKMVSLPEWMCDEARKKGISLSKVLQNALKEELGL